MTIKTIEFVVHKMQLVEPYTIAYESIDSCTNVFMKVITDNGITGFGCAAPDKEVTRETFQTVLTDIAEVIEPMLVNADPFRYNYLLEEMKLALPHSPSSRAMVDMLFFDLLSKKTVVPLFKFLGGFRTSIPTSITIGILPVDETLKKAKQFVEDGFRILKIKGGMDMEGDVSKLKMLRKQIGPKIELRFDANQGYSLEEAVKFVNETRDCDLEILEQPTPKNKYELLGKVTQTVKIPVMADESLMNVRDAFKLTTHELTDMMNIKLMKVGGISEAMHINSIAKVADVECMIGCMDESALAISAGLHFALSRKNVIYADLDGHLDLQDDPVTDAFILKNGTLYPSEKPGLGLDNLKLLE